MEIKNQPCDETEDEEDNQSIDEIEADIVEEEGEDVLKAIEKPVKKE